MLHEEKEEETVKLISAEGHEFIIDKNAAMVSGTIKSMLSGPGMQYLFFFFNLNKLFFNVPSIPYSNKANFSEKALGEIPFREISAPILEKVIQYFYYKLKYTNSASEVPEFPIEPEIALELLMAANFLDA